MDLTKPHIKRELATAGRAFQSLADYWGSQSRTDRQARWGRLQRMGYQEGDAGHAQMGRERGDQHGGGGDYDYS